MLHRLQQRSLRGGEERLRLDDVVAEIGDCSFGSLLLALALPAIPLPPGVAALLGAPLLLVSAQMLIGRELPWLPKALGSVSLAQPAAAKLFRRMSPGVSRLEAVLRPRASGLFNPLHNRLVAMACVALSVVLLTPAPLAHTAAAAGILAFAGGMVRRDGLATIAGWALTLTCALLLVLMVVAGSVAVARLL